jgi:hypothetical protein
VLFAGEPSRYGDRLSALPKGLACTAAPLWRRAVGAPPAARGHAGGSDAALERFVDVHAFAPGELRRDAQRAGLHEVRVAGEELMASWFGWINRTLEASADPDHVPWLWRQYAYRGYVLLQALDRRLLEPRLPAALFYNLTISARKPAAATCRRRTRRAQRPTAAGGTPAGRSAARTAPGGETRAAGRSSRR